MRRLCRFLGKHPGGTAEAGFRMLRGQCSSEAIYGVRCDRRGHTPKNPGDNRAGLRYPLYSCWIQRISGLCGELVSPLQGLGCCWRDSGGVAPWRSAPGYYPWLARPPTTTSPFLLLGSPALQPPLRPSSSSAPSGPLSLASLRPRVWRGGGAGPLRPVRLGSGPAASSGLRRQPALLG